MIKFTHSGSFRNTEKFLKSSTKDLRIIFERYGRLGVSQLEQATPVDTGLTAKSWDYAVKKETYGYSVSWYNTNMAGFTPVVIFIQYGHGTTGGTFVQGRDFINPAMKPIFDKLAEEIWKEVSAK